MGWTRAQWATVLRTWLVRRAVEPELSESWMADCGMCIPEPGFLPMLYAKRWWIETNMGAPVESNAQQELSMYVDMCMFDAGYCHASRYLHDVALQQSALALQLAGTQQQTGSLISGLFGGVIGGIFG